MFYHVIRATEKKMNWLTMLAKQKMFVQKGWT